jgi:hypothetical protein
MQRQNVSDQAGRLAAGHPIADAGSRVSAVGRLPRAAALVAVAAVAADLIVYGVAAALWGVPGEFAMLNPVSIVATALAGVVVAAVGLAVLARLTRRAVPLFVAAAIVVTLLSLAGPLQALAGAMPGLPAATTATGVTMLVLHLLTGGLIAGLLPAQARR